MDLTQVQDPTPNATLLASLYPSSSANNITKSFNQQSAAQQGSTLGSINNEQATATGATSSQNGVNPAWMNNGSQNDVPNTSSSSSNTQNSQLINPTTGSTTGQSSQNLANANGVLGLNSQGTASNTNNTNSNAQQSSNSGLTSLAGTVAQQLGLSGLKSTLSGVGSSITGAINDFGANTLGFGELGTSAGAQTLYQGFGAGADSISTGFGADGVATGFGAGGADVGATAGSLTGATLSSTLGGAGIGAAVGSVYAGLTGESGGKGEDSEVGGGIGGAIGTVILPGIGTAVGSVLGSIVGGLFGSNATSDSGYSGTLRASGGLDEIAASDSGKNPSQGTEAFVHQANNAFSMISQQASQALGINFNTAIDFDANDSTLHGGPNIGVNSNGQLGTTGLMSFDPSNATQTADTYYQALSFAAKASGYTDTTALYNWYYGIGAPTNGSNPTSINQGISIAPQGSSNAGLSIASGGSNSFNIG